MKKIISSLLALLMVVSILPVGIFTPSAKAATSGYYTYTVSNGKATITDVDTSISGDVVIPSTFGGYPVTEIGNKAFYECTSITTIKIPDSVTTICKNAFDYCIELTSVTIPDSVVTIDEYAFHFCAKLKSIVIPDSVTSIGSYAFRYCSSLAKITIPDSVKSIGYYVFPNTSYYNNSENWQDDVLYVGNHLVACKTSISGAYSIKDGTKTIAEKAFYNCTSLTSVTVPDSVVSVGLSAFKGCSKLSGVYITDIAAWCAIDFFDEYSNPLYYAELLYINEALVTNPSIPNSVTSISDYAFYGCLNFTRISIPDSVESIGNYAFYLCSRIASVTIPNSVTSIGKYAFSGTAYYYDDSNWQDGVLYIDSHLIDCRTALSEAYIVKSGTKTIADHAFFGCSYTNVTIPDSVLSIGEWAFSSCKNLVSISLGNGVTSIGERAFSSCENLESIVIPDSLISIGDTAFWYCTSLTFITIPNSVESIGDSAFSQCTGLASVTVPNSVTSIGKYAFSGCTNLCLNIVYTNDYAITYAEKNRIPYTKFHTSEATEIILEPTCTEKGYTEIVCSDCGYYEIFELSAIGHNYELIDSLEPTCTNKGHEKYTCTRCGDNKTDEIEALGHSYVLTDSLEPTCTEKGYNKYICSVCSGTKTEELETVDHIYKSTIVAPTCTEQGYTTHTCNCGDSYKTDYTASLGGHNFIIGDVIAPTPTEQGYTLYLCENCDATENRNYTSYVLPQKTLNVTVAPNDIGFSVSWDAVEFADSYYVRIREKDGTTNITNVNVKGTSYEFQIGKNGLVLDYDKEYTIQVIAQVDANYQKWADADKVTSKMVVGNRVVGITATEYKNGAQVTFRPVENATKYWVFVRNAADDSSVYTTSTTTTSVNIINNMVGGTEYYVQIVAYADKALDSRSNAIKTKFTAPYVLPSTYEIAASTPASFSITWDAVAGADTYFVQVIDEDDAPVRTVTVSGKTIAAVSMYSDATKLSANTTYRFRIAATINGVTTGYGEWMAYTTGGYEPVSVTAEKTNGKVKISWNDITDSHAVYLYRIDENGKRTYFKYLENGETSYTIKAPASGSYRYGVITVQRNISGDCYNPIAVSNTITF